MPLTEALHFTEQLHFKKSKLHKCMHALYESQATVTKKGFIYSHIHIR